MRRIAPIVVEAVASDAGRAVARALFEEYAAGLGIDLGFQGFDAELDRLGEMYGAPHGRLLLGLVDGQAQGCVAVRRLADGVCEMKRLYVRAAARGTGLGRLLAAGAVAAGRELGYERMVLDTLASMTAARALRVARFPRDRTVLRQPDPGRPVPRPRPALSAGAPAAGRSVAP